MSQTENVSANDAELTEKLNVGTRKRKGKGSKRLAAKKARYVSYCTL